MALQDYTIDTSGSPEDVKRRQTYADALLKQGGDSSPIQSPWQGVNRLAQGLMGGYERGAARAEEQQGRSSYQQQLAAALKGGNVSPQDMIALSGNQWANPAQLQTMTHMSDMQAQRARQAVEDAHWKATFGLQQRAAARADDKTPAGFASGPDGSYHPIPGGPADPSYIAAASGAKGADLPNSAAEWKFYKQNFTPTADNPQPMDYATFSTAKARAGATNVTTNIDPNAGQTYDKQLAEGLGKAHAGLANGVEDAQTRARDIAAMQGAIDSIQKNGGTTGGLGQQQLLDLKKTVNAASNAVGLGQQFNEGDIADKEFLTKFNRSMAGAQAKNAVGSRVTNFEMGNYLKANPGLDMSSTGNQRLLGIQAQMEQRNIAVGNAIREATAAAIASGRKIDPVTVQNIVKNYDDTHHIKDVITGQDLTQSYALPEFQNANPHNAAAAAVHTKNLVSQGAGADVMLEHAREALKAGAPREAVIKRLQGAGIDPSGL